MTDSTRGRLLVATPPLVDPNFLRTVVLVLEHTQDGALGVVLNRPTSTPVEDVLPAWAGLAAPPGVVHIGGPVQPDGMLALALLATVDPVDRPGVQELWPGVGTVDLDDPPPAPGFVEGVRCFAGYAGWGPGQLDGELATGSWFVVERDLADPWSAEPGRLWNRVLWRQRGRLAQFALCPLDPATN